MVITGCCLYVYFQSFAHYCITAEDINNNHGVYFKEKGTAPDFTTSCGAVYDDEEQDQILGVVQVRRHSPSAHAPPPVLDGPPLILFPLVCRRATT